MSFGQSIQTVFQKYAEFTGRARRPEFWWWVLFVFLVNLALNALWVPVGRGATMGSWLSGVWSIAILLPSLAVLVRRLRDAGHGWGHVFWLLLPFVGEIVLIVLAAQPSTDAAPRPAGPPLITDSELDSLPSMPLSPLAGAGAPLAAAPPVTDPLPEEPEELPPPGSTS
jgi:uncharacterized membrane protein YhaH (DUF805 family)